MQENNFTIFGNLLEIKAFYFTINSTFSRSFITSAKHKKLFFLGFNKICSNLVS